MSAALLGTALRNGPHCPEFETGTIGLRDYRVSPRRKIVFIIRGRARWSTFFSPTAVMCPSSNLSMPGGECAGGKTPRTVLLAALFFVVSCFSILHTFRALSSNSQSRQHQVSGTLSAVIRMMEEDTTTFDGTENSESLSTVHHPP